MEEDFLNWFAGFVAGEGCFIIHERPDGSWFVRLDLSQRDDNLDILLEIQERLGMGTLTRSRSRPDRQRLDPKPIVKWTVAKTSDCARLVSIFETHPLRANKQREFEIWKRAVSEIQKGMRGGGHLAIYDRNRLRYLKDKLKLIRIYEGKEKENDENMLEICQLSFYSEIGKE